MGRSREVFRLEYGRLVASVARIVRDSTRRRRSPRRPSSARSTTGPTDGMPDRPGAWLLTTARRRALDHLRRSRRAEGHAAALAYERDARRGDRGPRDDGSRGDPRRPAPADLHLLPSRPARGQPGRAHAAAGGRPRDARDRPRLPGARADIAQRLVRAKRAIRERGLPYEVPKGPSWPSAWPPCSRSIYLIFNEGYAAHAGEASCGTISARRRSALATCSPS